MQYYFNPRPLENYSTWAYYENAFTSEECDKIKEMFNGGVPAGIDGGAVNTDIRKANVVSLNYSLDTDWLYQKLTHFVLSCNFARYNYDLTGFIEPLQLIKYVKGDHYKWHQDNGSNSTSTRKLSVVLLLSDEDEYSGGELEFAPSTPVPLRPKTKGTLAIFPPTEPHRVTKVTKGERYTLVGWVNGPSFR